MFYLSKTIKNKNSDNKHFFFFFRKITEKLTLMEIEKKFIDKEILKNFQYTLENRNYSLTEKFLKIQKYRLQN